MSISTSLEYGKSIQWNIIRMRQNYTDNQDKLLSEKKVRQRREDVYRKKEYMNIGLYSQRTFLERYK